MVIRRSARIWVAGLATAATVIGTAALGVAEAASSAAAAPAQTAAAGPRLAVLGSQNRITVQKFGKNSVFFEPGIWLASFNSAFQIDVSRASYTRPITATEIIKTAAGTIRRPLPSWVLANWNGLRNFMHITIRNARGVVVYGSYMTFCPDGFNPSKATINSAETTHFPQECNSFDPFSLGQVWGIARGWAVEPVPFLQVNLALGRYTLTGTVRPRYARLFGISPRNTSATVRIDVVKYRAGAPRVAVASTPAHFVRANVRSTRHGQARLPNAPLLRRAPAGALPDLIPLPSWGISAVNPAPKHTGDSYLDFGATVWIGGNGPLDVEGFRSSGSGTMQAYQYFWRGHKLLGRMRVGTMGFSSYNAWHFQQFAQYFLLNAHKKVVVRSRKIGFCIAPTDNVDLLLRNATWIPTYTGIQGNCGDPAALWVAELLPNGWGDTYFQTVPYQSFEITNLPNGVYYIEIVANPEHLLHESNTSNDVSLRKVIISGLPGHRHVRVPAYDGLDPENNTGLVF